MNTNAIPNASSANNTVDIVELIKNNPLQTLTHWSNGKLTEKIKESFTETQQELFIASFYCYLKYDQYNDFVVDLNNVWQWLDFSSKEKAKRLLVKTFTEDKDYKVLSNIILTSPSGEQKNNDNLNEEKKENRGGHNKQQVLMTVNTFKLLSLKAQTKKADEIHEYYVKLENIIQQVTKEENQELLLRIEEERKQSQEERKQSQEEKETIQKENQKLQEEIEKTKKEKLMERHKTLLENFNNKGPIVYIIKVKTLENGLYIVKIGESRMGISSRYNEHKSKHEECIILDVFSVDKSKELESFIHSHETVRHNKVTDLQGHTNEKELFLIGKNLTYQILKNIITSNIHRFNNNIHEYTEMMRLENEQQKLNIISNTENNDDKKELIQSLYKIDKIKELEKTVEKLEKTNKEILEKLNLLLGQSQSPITTNTTTIQPNTSNTTIIQPTSSNTSTIQPTPLIQPTKLNNISIPKKTTTGFGNTLSTLGPRLQQINPENMELIKSYESVSECISTQYKLKRPSIEKAIKENTVYCGFRWVYVDRHLDPNIIHNIEPTKLTHTQELGYIAKLNSEKTEILNVYLDRKTAAIENGYSASGLDYFVKNGKSSNGCCYMLYEDCIENIKSAFLEKHFLPEDFILYKNGVGQFNEDGTLNREFECKYMCIRQLKISDKTLFKALDKNIAYNGYFYRTLGSKIKLLI
jgi:hypothetical protein